MQLATQPEMGDNVYLNLLAAANPFWGQSIILVTLLIAFNCLLSCGFQHPPYFVPTCLGRTPFACVHSRFRRVSWNLLILTFYSASLCLGDLSLIFLVAGTGYIVSIMGIHLGLWLRWGRQRCDGLGGHCVFIMEAVVLVVGGLAWGCAPLIGLLFPIVILAGDAAVRRISFAPFHPKWWLQRYHAHPITNYKTLSSGDHPDSIDL